eukprot:scaffold5591_cov70-Skeletonema_dohrnii-CCMP3373.AAC.20
MPIPKLGLTLGKKKHARRRAKHYVKIQKMLGFKWKMSIMKRSVSKLGRWLSMQEKTPTKQ